VELYDHVTTHVKTGNDDSQKKNNVKPKMKIKDNAKNENKLIRQIDIDTIKKKIEELQKRIETHTNY